jgi:hypothetical protein
LCDIIAVPLSPGKIPFTSDLNNTKKNFGLVLLGREWSDSSCGHFTTKENTLGSH